MFEVTSLRYMSAVELRERAGGHELLAPKLG